MEFNILGRFDFIWDPPALLVELNAPTITERELQNKEKEEDLYKIATQIQRQRQGQIQ